MTTNMIILLIAYTLLAVQCIWLTNKFQKQKRETRKIVKRHNNVVENMLKVNDWYVHDVNELITRLCSLSDIPVPVYDDGERMKLFDEVSFVAAGRTVTGTLVLKMSQGQELQVGDPFAIEVHFKNENDEDDFCFLDIDDVPSLKLLKHHDKEIAMLEKR